MFDITIDAFLIATSLPSLMGKNTDKRIDKALLSRVNKLTKQFEEIKTDSRTRTPEQLKKDLPIFLTLQKLIKKAVKNMDDAPPEYKKSVFAFHDTINDLVADIQKTIQQKLYVKQSITQAIKDVRQGNTMTSEQFFEALKNA